MSTPKKTKTAKTVAVADPAAIEALLQQVDALDWDTLSGGYAKKFPKQFRSYVQAKTPAAAQKELLGFMATYHKHPVGGLVAKFLVRLLAIEHAPEVPTILVSLVRLIAMDPAQWMHGPFSFERARFPLSRCNKWKAVAEGLPALLSLAKSDRANVRSCTAYVLAWLGAVHTKEIVPVLTELCSDSSAEVRASAALALGLHGASVPEALLRDSDQRVRLCAALGASFVPSAMPAMGWELLEAVLPPAEGAEWDGFPWLGGNLQPIVLARYVALSSTNFARAKTHLEPLFETPAAAELAASLVEQTFADRPVREPWNEAQKFVLSMLVKYPDAASGDALGILREANVDLGSQYAQVHQMLEHLRKKLGLPRRPPATEPKRTILHEGAQVYAQHLWAEHAFEHGGNAVELAASMVSQLSMKELVELLLRRDLYEPDFYEGANAAFTLPFPSGGTPRGGLLVWEGKEFVAKAKELRQGALADGWALVSEEWSNSDFKFVFAKGDQVFRGTIGHDWNEGNVRWNEFELRWFTRWSLALLVAQGARAKDEAAFTEALLASVQEERARVSGRTMYGVRVLYLAILAWVTAGKTLPPAMDEALFGAQFSTGRMTGLFHVCARALPKERAVALLLRIRQEGQPGAELAAVAPTEEVLGAYAQVAAAQLDQWKSYPQNVPATVTLWERYLGAASHAFYRKVLEQKNVPPAAQEELTKRLALSS